MRKQITKAVSFIIAAAAVTAMAVLLDAPVSQAAKTPAVEEIVRKSNLAAYYPGKDGTVRVRMTITDSRGSVREREFAILRRNVEEGGRQKFYVYFHRPADVRKMVFMVWKNIGRDDDRWLYLPALDLVRRIAASDKRSSFVGSHFVYEDVSGRGIEEDRHELTGTEEKYYVLKNTPKDPVSVEFSYYYVWIDRATYLPVRAEYYSKIGKKFRIVEALETRTIQGYPTVTKSRVRNLETGGQTVSVFSNVKYDVGIKDGIFTERYLRRAPRKWIRTR